MATVWNGWYWNLGSASLIAISGVIATLSDCVAQVTPDGTLPNNSIVTPQGNTSIIDGGTTAGGNLFHSFEEFSVPTGGAAYFNNALEIQNILSRVTGGSISNINGLLRANASANVFLLNPNGINFGSQATLNIGGSFVGSTASAVNFADGTQFSATATTTTPLLTVSVPIGLQFGQNPGSIVVQGTGYDLSVEEPLFSPIIRGSSSTGLRVPQGKTLALVGGDVDIEGGTLTADLGMIELGSVGGNGQVSLSPIPQGFALSYQDGQRGDIRLSQQAFSDASGGGSIQVVGKRISLTDGSKFLIQNQGVQSGGSISVNATESLSVSGTNPDGRISGGVESETVGGESGADIAIFTPQLVIQGGASIAARSRSPGKGGNVTVNAADSVQLIGSSPINPTFATVIAATAHSSGDAGDVTVSTGRLIGLNGGQIISATFGTGSGGDITVDALDSVELMGQTSLFAPSGLNAATTNAGNAGKLTVNTSRLAIRDGGTVNSSSLATGNAGGVTINATESVEVSGRVLMSPNSPTFLGSSAPILAGTLQATYRIPPVPSGESGDVTINTDNLSVTDGALVDVRNEGSRDGGTLRVNARSIFLDNLGGITAATASGVGGNIYLEAQNLLLRDNSAITATAGGGTGNGGNLTINTGTLVALEDSDITADAVEGRGGNIQISTQVIISSADSNITASSERGINGVVEINNPDVDQSLGLVTLPAELVDVTGLIATGCPEAVWRGENKFIVTGRGGLPPNPRQVLSSNAVQVDWVELSAAVENRTSVDRGERQRESSPTEAYNTVDVNRPVSEIVEAQGWIVDANGNVTLVANPPTAMPHSPWQTPADCRAVGRQ